MSTAKWTQKVAVREDFVQNAVTFLRSEDVAKQTFESKIKFLRNKGLTDTEIDAALERFEFEERELRQKRRDSFLTTEKNTSLWTSFLFPLMLGASSVSGLLFLLNRFPQYGERLSQFYQNKLFFNGKDQDSSDTAENQSIPFEKQSMYGWRRQGVPHSSKVEELLEKQNATLIDLISKARRSNSLLENQNNMLKSIECLQEETKKLAGEVRTIKTLLVTESVSKAGSKDAKDIMKVVKQVEDAIDESEATKNMDSIGRLLARSRQQEKAQQEEAQQEEERKKNEDVEALKQEKKNVIDAAISEVEKSNTGREKLKIGTDTILLYIGNLLSNWDKKMYGRISTLNRTYQTNLEGIEGHQKLLTSCGFEVSEVGASYTSAKKQVFEFSSEWRENGESWATEVVRYGRDKLLQLKERLNKPVALVEAENEAQSVDGDISKDIMEQVSEQEQAESFPLSFKTITDELKKDPNWKPADVKEVEVGLSSESEKLMKLPDSFVPPNIEEPPRKPWEENPDFISNKTSVEAKKGGE